MKQFLCVALLFAGIQSAIAQTSPHGTIRFSCDMCHTTDSWKMRTDAQFSHDATGFDLTGMHLIVQCRNCHQGLKFSGVRSACQSCHTDIHKGELGSDCLRCHSTKSWKIADMIERHQQTRFPLLGQHAATPCDACHARNVNQQYTGTPTTCIGCHRNEYQNAQNPNHLFAGFSTDCTQCHLVNAPTWGGSFNHQLTVFPLTGAHQAVPCTKCHTTNAFKTTPQECYSCHASDYATVQSPNHAAGSFSHQCMTCHTTTVWKPSQFNHDNTLFALVGAHRTVPCEQCHLNGQFSGMQKNCIDCHRTDFNGVKNPNHMSASFSSDCLTCHSMNVWKPATFDHGATRFALTGKHLFVQCQDCHTNGNYQLVYSNCYQCHQSDYQKTTNPNHANNNFAQTCELCHSNAGWSPAAFDHSLTKFVLTGKHTSTLCNSCHVNNNYQLTYTDCYSCHQTDFQKPVNPNHITGNFTHACNQCHTTTGWIPSTFNHSTTTFALRGAHQAVPCANCHVNNVYAGLHQNCIDCHQADYNGAQNPNHVTASFSSNCLTCHSMNGWSPATFDHTATKFSLTGKHLTALCQDCHANGNYQLGYMNCSQCHLSDYQRTTNPNHVSSNFGQTCESCHSTAGWSPAAFDHSVTKLALTGKHASTQCSACHANNNYQLTYTDCYACHQSDFQKPLNPNHVAGYFAHTCVQCHTTTVWTPSTFSHSTTPFPLTGAHQAVPCANCHVNNVFAGLHQNCIDCHQTDYNATTNPKHIPGSFSTMCTTCHTTNAWSPASFDHSITKFNQMTGKHIGIACVTCHVNNNYQLTYVFCYQCHQTDYQGATSPNHAAGYPQTCDSYQCHSTASWTTSTFNHDTQYFKIYSGKHNGRWTTCTRCHTTASDYVSFSCLNGCHSQSSTDSNHSGVKNYIYASPNCYSCHKSV